MKTILTLLSFFIIASFIQSAITSSAPIDESKGIQFFNGTFEDALERAKAENKLIFLDAYASWCGPCRRMKSKVFTQEDVGSYFNSKFINLKIDMEKGEGPALSQQYNVQAYPTLFFLNHEGDVKQVAVGYYSPNRLLELAKTVQE